MNDYILYISLMVIGACIWNVWTYTKYLETKNAVLLRMLMEKGYDADLATRTRNADSTSE
jgi:hypothetical protein